ncbi:Glyco_hydro_17 domain-containing protein/X8 domain-containing protein, partial [Cephalotus follicularis]
MATTTTTTTHSLLLLTTILLHLSTTATAIGVNYGTLADNLPPPSQVANFLKTQTTIDSIKLFDVNQDIIRAFANTGIYVSVTVPNGEIPSLTNMRIARRWVNTNIKPFYPQTKIKYICVGNEILHWGGKDLIFNLVPAMRVLHRALVRAGFNDIKVTTPHSLGILQMSVPPSQGRFRYGFIKPVLAPMLKFLRETKSPFMFNPYPYFGYSPNQANYVLFRPNRGVHDKYTGITYTNMFEALIDATYSAMKAIGYGDVGIVLGETGWPSLGEPFLTQCTVANAVQFNGHVANLVSSGKGTPLMPNRKFETYIFALFNENQKPGSIAEKNFGLFRPDFSPVYDIGIMRNGRQVNYALFRCNGFLSIGKETDPYNIYTRSINMVSLCTQITSFWFWHLKQYSYETFTQTTPAAGKKWCVPRADASEQALKSNIDYACSQGVDCNPIQAGGACFDPNNIKSHAAFVMNSYYQSHGRNDFNCDFSHTGVLSTSDPSK